MATYRERDSIARVIADFLATGLADEIIVVDNNAEPGTREAIAGAASSLVRVVHEPRQGYGFTFQKGYHEASGDLIVTVEPDGTYAGSDLRRFLTFGEDFPVVLGSRTILKVINKDWGFWRREANILYGYLIHLLFNTQMVTDIGCTYKLIRREALEHLQPLWQHGSSLLATEILLSVVRERIPFTEIPVTFLERVGPSVVIENPRKLIKLAFQGLGQILGGWWQWKTGNRYV